MWGRKLSWIDMEGILCFGDNKKGRREVVEGEESL